MSDEIAPLLAPVTASSPSPSPTPEQDQATLLAERDQLLRTIRRCEGTPAVAARLHAVSLLIHRP